MEVGRYELPEAFEAEERSVPGLGDLLHLVSGRTLLGSVRERHAQNLGSTGHMGQHIGAATDAPPQLGESYQDSHSRTGDTWTFMGLTPGHAIESSKGSATSGEVRTPLQKTGSMRTAVHREQTQASHKASSDQEHLHSDSRSSIGGRDKQPADVLDLYLNSDTGEQLIATAVRPQAPHAPHESARNSSMTDHASGAMPDANADSDTEQAGKLTPRLAKLI